MITCVALLRGINVGGRKLIKMEELRRIFTSAGCKNARTYIESGDAIFSSASKNPTALYRKINRRWKKSWAWSRSF